MPKHKRLKAHKTERIATDNLSFATHMERAFNGRTELWSMERRVFEADLRFHAARRPSYSRIDPAAAIATELGFHRSDVLRILYVVSLICRWREYLDLPTCVPDRYIDIPKPAPVKPVKRKQKWYNSPKLFTQNTLLR